MIRLFLSVAAILTIARHPIRTLKAVVRGAKEGWSRGSKNGPKMKMPSLKGRVMEVEILPERPPHRTYSFSHETPDPRGDSDVLAICDKESTKEG